MTILVHFNVTILVHFNVTILVHFNVTILVHFNVTILVQQATRVFCFRDILLVFIICLKEFL